MNTKHLFRAAMLGISSIFRPTFVATICGHETKKEGTVRVFGKNEILSIPVDEEGHTPYCLDCVGRMAIRCALCDEVIYVGEVVALCEVRCLDVLPKHAVRYKWDERYALCCLRDDLEITSSNIAVFTPELSPYTQELLAAYRIRHSQ